MAVDNQKQERVSRQSEFEAVRVDGLTKKFGKGEDAIVAVDNVSFSIKSGEIVGILGPNGAGKTTTIKSILGLITPDEGSVEINGVNIYKNPRQAYNNIDGMMEGARNQYWRLTVEENLRYFTKIGGENPQDVRERYETLLNEFNLFDHKDKQVRNISRGMKQKVSIASTLARDVDIVFLDEPTLGLDVESSITLRRTLRELAKERDLTVLLSSHDMDIIEDVCDRVIILKEGAVIKDSTVDRLLDVFDEQKYELMIENASNKELKNIKNKFDIENINFIDESVQFETTADSMTFYQLTSELESIQAQLRSVQTTNPNLEEVFLNIAGDDNE